MLASNNKFYPLVVVQVSNVATTVTDIGGDKSAKVVTIAVIIFSLVEAGLK